ncbi:hypothetical protein TSACC_3293 [Terrimicrobium sacchariphilum]|uniref:Uncharacterized protein n=1 Tax=Terrimicrobium sacchariphilum TaxID=690879 RepID=A0A146GCA3_TERSA|nr:hypothetical protein [Terrimicrobium sacchariphilum]GAT35229.1 hypothetical protein TSACC_3293 [Terrimicrobium sacchariphilum]
MKALVLILCTLISLGSLCAKTPLLAVDFNAQGKGAASPTMPGFQPFDVSMTEANGPVAASFSPADNLYPSQLGVSVTTGKSESDSGPVAGRLCTVDPSMANLPLGALYYDAICSLDGNPLIVSITGLKAGKKYTIEFFSFTSTRSGNQTLTDITSGEGGEFCAIEWVKDFQFSDSTPEEEFSASLTATADASGKVIISISNKLGSPLLSGFRISEN